MKKNFKLVSKHAWQRQGEDFPACLLWKGNSGSIAHFTRTLGRATRNGFSWKVEMVFVVDFILLFLV